jgi:hypothetical protein
VLLLVIVVACVSPRLRTAALILLAVMFLVPALLYCALILLMVEGMSHASFV